VDFSLYLASRFKERNDNYFCFFGIAGLIVDPVYALDWWFPPTITGTMPGIESILLGFSMGGIAAVAYLELFQEKLKLRREKKNRPILVDISHIWPLTACFIIFLFDFFILGWNSFFSSLPALVIPLAFILLLRRDLILDSFFSGVLMLAVSMIFYFVPEIIFPGWISYSWNCDMISGITIFKVPLEDLVWFLLSGMFIGPLYEFWKNAKIVPEKRIL